MKSLLNARLKNVTKCIGMYEVHVSDPILGDWIKRVISNYKKEQKRLRSLIKKLK
jgi:hypothetical protein